MSSVKWFKVKWIESTVIFAQAKKMEESLTANNVTDAERS